MNPVYICFSKTLSTPSEDFMTKVIEGLVQFYHREGGTNNFNTAELSTLVSYVRQHLQNAELPIIDVENHKENISERWEDRRNQSIECADTIIHGIMGNNSAQHSYSCLKEDWNGFEKGVAVATRNEIWNEEPVRTYFIFPNTVITEEGRMGQTHPRFPYEKETLIKNNAIVQSQALLQKEPLDCILV